MNEQERIAAAITLAVCSWLLLIVLCARWI